MKSLRIMVPAAAAILLAGQAAAQTDEPQAAIGRAEARGVQVRILTNSINSNNHLTAHSAYRKHVRTLVEMGAEVHELGIMLLVFMPVPFVDASAAASFPTSGTAWWSAPPA